MTKTEFDELIIQVQNLYNKDLIKNFVVMVTPLLTQNRTFLASKGLDVSFLAKKHGQLTKLDMIKMLIMPFFSAEIYQQFLDTLNKNQRKVWDYVVMCGIASNSDIEKDLGIKTGEMEINISEHAYWRVKPTYIVKDEYAFLPHPIRPTSYSYYGGSPDGANFFVCEPLAELATQYSPNILADLGLKKTVPQKIEAKYFFSFERNILSEFPRLLLFQQQGNIVTNYGGLLNQTGWNKTHKAVAINEFYPNTTDKKLKFMRTHLLSTLIAPVKSKSFFKKDTEDNIKKIFEEIFMSKYQHPNNLLYYLKNAQKIDYNDYNYGKERYWNFLQKMLTKEWASVDNLVLEFSLYYGNFLPQNTAYMEAYYEGDEGVNVKVNEYNFRQMIAIPTFKGCLFLFAAYGLVEIACDELDMNVKEKTTFSFYDNLKYTRLTALGEYVLSKAKKYLPDFQSDSNKFVLSDTNLTIVIEAEERADSTKMLLTDFAEKISATRYKTDYKIFLKGCKSQMELQNKIKMFKSLMDKKTPQIWAEFFEELLKKINPAKLLPDCLVYQIPKENVGLIQLISNDKELRDCIMRAEEFCIIVQKSRLNAFRKRLQEFGYLLLE
jgi:hypothetical protein